MLDPHAWTTVGLSLDIAGAALLALEAIKVESLETIAARLRAAYNDARPRERGPWAYALGGLLLLGGSAAVSNADYEAPGIGGDLLFVAGWLVALLAFAVMLFWDVVRSLFVAVSAPLLEVAVRAVARVGRRAPPGTFGFAGFALLATGFAFQIVGA